MAASPLDRLRKAMEIGIRPEEVRYLADVEKRIKELSDYQALAARPAIRALLEWCRRDIDSTNERLSTDRGLLKDGHEGERLAMLERKEVLSYLVTLFDPTTELEELEKQLSDKAEEYENHNGMGNTEP